MGPPDSPSFPALLLRQNLVAPLSLLFDARIGPSTDSILRLGPLFSGHPIDSAPNLETSFAMFVGHTGIPVDGPAYSAIRSNARSRLSLLPRAITRAV